MDEIMQGRISVKRNCGPRISGQEIAYGGIRAKKFVLKIIVE